MESNEFKFSLNGEVLYVEFLVPYDFKKLEETIELIKHTFPDHLITIVARKGLTGYWSAFDYKLSSSIYCGTRSEKNTRESIEKHIKSRRK